MEFQIVKPMLTDKKKGKAEKNSSSAFSKITVK
jgi:hypothetical protein